MNILLTPALIGPVEIPNRIVMPSMTTRTASLEGYVTDACLAYYGARAAGGTGLVTVEMAAPERAGRHRRHELGICHDGYIPGLIRLVEEIHRHDAKASIQLGHGGGHTRVDISGETPIAPSAVPHPVYEVTLETIVPEAMSLERIAETTDAYVAAARRAQDCGFDCIEIHAAHGYLISQFHAPFENRRTDEYGGGLDNRARFGLDILRAVKKAVPALGIIYRLSVDDFFDGGLTYGEGRVIVIWAARAGADAIHVTAGHYRSLPTAHRMIPPMAEPDGPFLAYAADIKRVVTCPIIVVGRMGDPALATHAVASGKADFVALGRSLIADPQWVRKLADEEPIRRCLACNTCIDGMRGGGGIACVVNGTAGRETLFAGAAPPQGERIAVIGAGPAGLTYASLTAEGNNVTVFDKEAVAGGAFRYAGLAPMFQEVEANPFSLHRYIADLVATCLHKNVTFTMEVDVARQPELLEPFDRIVVATGASYLLGLGPLLMKLLERGAAHWPVARRVMTWAPLRNWFYYRARRATGARFARLARGNQIVTIIGDAASPGKSKEAIGSAFEAALLPPRPALHPAFEA